MKHRHMDIIIASLDISWYTLG